eukprot:6212612-Alexandrium_andersonii.AAC.1
MRERETVRPAAPPQLRASETGTATVWGKFLAARLRDGYGALCQLRDGYGNSLGGLRDGYRPSDAAEGGLLEAEDPTPVPLRK